MTYGVNTGQFGGINAPEVIVAESSYGVLFEGRPAAISADGQLLVLSQVRQNAYPISTGPGLVVSILAEVNANGSANMTLAGTWYQVAQQVSLSSDNSIELLMENPLPPMPQGGYYVIEVTGGFVNNSIVDNTLNLSGKSSTGIQLDGEDYGSRIVGNHFIGGTIYETVYTGTAISIGATINSAPGGSGAFPLPAGWTPLPNLGTVIEDNVIQDSLGGIIIGVMHGVNYWGAMVGTDSETGRVFVTATVTGNTFEFDSSFLSSWAAASAADQKQTHRKYHSTDNHDWERLHRRRGRTLRQPTVSLDRRQRVDRQWQRSAHFCRPDGKCGDGPVQFCRVDRDEWHRHTSERAVRPGVRGHRQRRD